MNDIATSALCAFLCGGLSELAGPAQVWADVKACERNLFVAVTANPQNGDGSAGSPYRTITSAVERARQIRADKCTDPIVIHVGPGDYVGSFPIGTSTVETLPILIDIPDLELHGSTVLDTDKRGLPTGASRSASTLTISGATSDELTAMIFVASDSGQTNHVTVSGFVLDASGGSDPDTVGIAIDRAQDFIVRGNIVTGLPGPSGGPGKLIAGISTRAASGLIEANYMTNNFIGIAPTGGNGTFPANVTVNRNRATGNDLMGVGFAGTGDTAYPFNPRAESTVNETFDTIVGTVTENDFSNNVGSGIRLAHQTLQTAASASEVTATVANNTMDGNAYGIVIDAEHTYRGPLLYTGSTTAKFENNAISNSSVTRVLVTFEGSISEAPILPSSAATDPKQTLLFKYLQNSSYTITHTGELDGVWIDHPEQDPVDCRKLCNQLRINGVDIPPPFRSKELGDPFLSVCPAAPPKCLPQPPQL